VKVFRGETLHDLDYDEIVALLRGGGIIGFPTDTAYGLGCDPFDKGAVERLFRLKGRPETKPILLVIDSLAMAESISQPSEMFRAVANKFWPGPLTVVVEAKAAVPDNVTAGTGTIGLRWPVAPIATNLLKRFGKPITATSANRTGQLSAITAGEIRLQFGEGLDAIVDGGSLPVRGGSTLLDITADPPILLREGPISYETLQTFFNGRIRRQVA
jgi:L-threonylcarbamoyladenylate synthase